MNLKLISLTGIKLDQQIYSAVLPTADGEISVFPVHEQLVTLARPGIIEVTFEKDGDEKEYFAISGGVIEIDQTSIKVMVDEADHADDILEAEAKAALEHALKLQEEAGDQVEREKAHQLVDRHMVRLKVADLQRRKRKH